MRLLHPPAGANHPPPRIWAFPRIFLDYNGKPVIVLVRIWQVNSPYHTKPKPLDSSIIDNLNTLAGKLALYTITCKERGPYPPPPPRACMHMQNLPKY